VHGGEERMGREVQRAQVCHQPAMARQRAPPNQGLLSLVEAQLLPLKPNVGDRSHPWAEIPSGNPPL